MSLYAAQSEQVPPRRYQSKTLKRTSTHSLDLNSVSAKRLKAIAGIPDEETVPLNVLPQSVERRRGSMRDYNSIPVGVDWARQAKAERWFHESNKNVSGAGYSAFPDSKRIRIC